MKRVYLILTLFMTSFFFVSLNKVRADEFNYVIPEDEISFIETDTFKRIRELAIELAIANNQYYLINLRQTTNFSVSNIYVSLFNKGDYSVILDTSTSSFPKFNHNKVEIKDYKYSSTTDSLYYNGFYNYPNLNFQSYDSNNFPIYSYSRYLDSNIEFLPFDSSKHVINLNYNNNIYTINHGEHYPSLCQLKLLYDAPSGDDNIERNDSLDSFYALVIEKIQIFANSFISNNACLFIIGIITLIFVFELVRRWLL